MNAYDAINTTDAFLPSIFSSHCHQHEIGEEDLMSIDHALKPTLRPGGYAATIYTYIRLTRAFYDVCSVKSFADRIRN